MNRHDAMLNLPQSKILEPKNTNTVYNAWQFLERFED